MYDIPAAERDDTYGSEPQHKGKTIDLTYNLGTESDQLSARRLESGKPDPPEWRKPKHNLLDGSVTHLLSIHSAEHRTFRDGTKKILLFCPDQSGGLDQHENSPIKLRWL